MGGSFTATDLGNFDLTNVTDFMLGSGTFDLEGDPYVLDQDLTANGTNFSNGRAEQLRDCGFGECLEKPFEIKELIDRIELVMGQ